MSKPQHQSNFPFADEWPEVTEIARALANATISQDWTLQDSLFCSLQETLHDLQNKYGVHPVLLETEADFHSDPAEQICLYEQALKIAISGGHSTLSIRLSLAEVLIEFFELRKARIHLESCVNELSGADESERRRWCELDEASRA